MDNPFITYWYFHIPNYLLAILMYMTLGRFILAFFFLPDSKNVIWRAFVRITDPPLGLVRVVTPKMVPDMMLLLFSFFWLFLARIAFTIILAANDLLPEVPGA